MRDEEIVAGKWDKPVVLSGLDVAFGAGHDLMEKVLPAWKEIPEDFTWNGGSGKGEARQWIHKVEDWFYKGITALKVTMKEDVDPDVALRHLRCIIGSFEPKHEHKTAGAAYLMSLWYHRFDYTVVKK